MKYLDLRGSNYRYYRRVPKAVRAHSDWAGRTFVKESLRTGDLRTAERRYAAVHARVEAEFEKIEQELQAGDQPKQIWLMKDDEIRQLVWAALYLWSRSEGKDRPPTPEEFLNFMEEGGNTKFSPHLIQRIQAMVPRWAEVQANVDAAVRPFTDNPDDNRFQRTAEDVAMAYEQYREPLPLPPVTMAALTDSYLQHPDRQRLDDAARRGYVAASEMLREVIGPERYAHTITRSDLRHFQDVVLALPPNAKKRPEYQDVPFAEIAADAKARRAKGDKLPSLRPEVANKYLSAATRIFAYAVRENMIDRTPAEGLVIRTSGSTRTAFTLPQLRRMFHQNYPLVGNTWIPLVALLQGMRGNEIAQMDLTDVRQVNGVWCFHISVWSEDEDGTRTRNGKSVKNRPSERVVPIHKRLIQLGLLNHVAERRRLGSVKLFDVALWGDSYWDSVRTAMYKLMDEAGIRTEHTTFHSFRHAWNTYMKDAGADHLHRLFMGGWSMPDNQGDSRYLSWMAVERLQETLDKLDFDLPLFERITTTA
jgi:integrase